MRRTRAIPVLLLHQGGIYKTTKFKSLVYIGDPINAIRLFNDMMVDEIIILDIDASKSCSAPNYELISHLSSEAFMPFAYGGGINTVDHARRILQCGVEKVILNHAIQLSKDLISDCAERFGSQSVVASIDYKKKLFGGYVHYDHVAGKRLNMSVVDAAIAFEKAGAGEIMINSVDRDGTMSGLDCETIHQVAQAVQVPVIACGGAGIIEHLKEAAKNGASAIAAGSMFVFHGKQRGVLINYPNETKLRRYIK